jgi:hypothetical protein
VQQRKPTPKAVVAVVATVFSSFAWYCVWCAGEVLPESEYKVTDKTLTVLQPPTGEFELQVQSHRQSWCQACAAAAQTAQAHDTAADGKHGCTGATHQQLGRSECMQPSQGHLQ